MARGENYWNYWGSFLVCAGVSWVVEGERRRPTIPMRLATQAPSLSDSTFRPPSSASVTRMMSPLWVR
jgi:hypothetical protein